MIEQLALLLPVGVVLGAALVVVFLDLMIPKKDRYILPWVGMGGLILAGLAIYHVFEKLGAGSVWFQMLPAKPDDGFAGPLILNGSFCLDRFGVSAWLVCAVAGFLAILAGPVHAGQGDDPHPLLTTGEYYGLILLTVAGMMLLCVSYDWITLLLSLEIMSIATYILTGSHRENSKSNEGAMKYLVLGAFSSAFLMMGIAFYYGAFGHISVGATNWTRGLLSFPDEIHARSILLWVSMGLILVGVLFKMGAAPFHAWVPDVYEGAPPAITGLMAVGVKTAAFAVAARLAFDTFSGSRMLAAKWVDAILVISVLTMIVGNILAMRQSNVKRMLAYSGIAHTGYLLLALLLIQTDRGGYDPIAVESHTKAMLFYLLTYGVMTLGAFGVIAMVREDGRPLETIDDFKGLAKEHPGVALCMAIFMFSLAGLPPTGGFFAKFAIFRSAMEQAQYKPEIIVAAVIGVLTSVASLYYYLKVVVAMYMPEHGEEEGAATAKCNYEWNSSLLIYAAGIVSLIVGLMPGWFWF